MTTQLKENNFSVDANKEEINTVNPRSTRPNIDHFIKRILVVRRKEKKKNFLIFFLILSVIFGLIILAASN
jgi:hypothetical protein